MAIDFYGNASGTCHPFRHSAASARYAIHRSEKVLGTAELVPDPSVQVGNLTHPGSEPKTSIIRGEKKP